MTSAFIQYTELFATLRPWANPSSPVRVYIGGYLDVRPLANPWIYLWELTYILENEVSLDPQQSL